MNLKTWQKATPFPEKVAASTEQQLASMEEITASAKTLSTMAEELQELISRFKHCVGACAAHFYDNSIFLI